MTIEKRESSPVDATIINGSKLLGSPKIDPIKMNRTKKAAGLLLQISHCAAAPALCKRRRAGWNGWYAAALDLVAWPQPKGYPIHVSDLKTGLTQNDR